MRQFCTIVLSILLILGLGCAPAEETAPEAVEAPGEDVAEVEPDMAALFREQPPATVCDYLEEEGLATGEYVEVDGVFRCVTGPVELAAELESLEANNAITYSVIGTESEAQQLQLKLDLLEPGAEASALEELLRYGDRLAMQAVKAPLPDEIEAAIRTGGSEVFTTEEATFQLKRDELAQEDTYRLELTIA